MSIFMGYVYLVKTPGSDEPVRIRAKTMGDALHRVALMTGENPYTMLAVKEDTQE